MAANQQQIDMIVNAIAKGFDKVIDETKKVEKATDDAAETAKKGGLKWTELKSGLDLAMGAYRKVAAVAKAAYEAVSEGAQLNLAADRFDNLTASIGTTSQSMLTDLRAATKGMQSDAQLIAGATDIISLGLADTQEGTVRLATAVSTLGLDMQQVILTFANNSKARLDALGLSIEDVDAKTRELEANGFQGDAFDEAVLIALEEKMTLLGDASQTTAGSLQILETSWKNYTDSLKQGAADALAPTIKNLADNRQRIEALRDAYDKNILTYREYNDAVSKINVQGQDMIEVMRDLGVVMNEQGNIIGTVTEDGVKLNAMYEKQTAAVEAATEAYVQHDEKLRGVNRALLEFSGDLGPTTRELEEMAYASGDAASSKEQLADGIDRAKAAMEAEAKAAEDATKAEEEAARAAKERAASMGDLFVAAIESKDGIGLFNETAAQMTDRTIYNSNLTREQRDALSDLQAEYEKAQGIIADYTIGAKGVGMETEAVNEKVAEQQERMAELQAAMEPLLAVGGEYANVQGTMTINQEALNQAIFDAADSQGASAEQLAILGGALGLYSDEAVEAALQTALIQAKIEELTAQYLAGDISVSQMRASVQDFIATINEVPTQHDIVFRITTEGSIPTIPNAPSGGQQAAAFASGTNGWVTVPGPAGAAVPIVVHGGEQMNVIPNGQTGGNGNGRGGVVQNNYFSNPQSPNAIATATAEKLGQLK